MINYNLRWDNDKFVTNDKIIQKKNSYVLVDSDAGSLE
jgi:hypothetical protein